MLDASSFTKKIGMNSSLLRQYKTGHAFASDKQKKRIETGLRQLGKQLLKKFDRFNLTPDQLQILDDFITRRRKFDAYLTERKIPLVTCLGCD